MMLRSGSWQLVWICFLLLCSSRLQAQNWTDEVETRLQSMGLSEQDLATYMQNLEQYRLEPLNINTDGSDELRELPFLDDFFIRNLIAYRHRHGAFATVYALKQVPGAVLWQLRLLEPYLSVATPSPSQKGVPSYRSLAFASVALPKTSSTETLARSMSQRTRVQVTARNRWDMAWTASKGKGEPWQPLAKGLWDTQHLYFYWRKKGTLLSSFVLGDYRLNFGMGLLNGMGISYYSRTESSYRYGISSYNGFRPHRGFGDGNYCRGAAFRLERGPFSLLPFFAYTPMDARLTEDGSSIRTLYRDRRRTSLLREASKNQVRNENWGLYVAYDRSPLQAVQLHMGLQLLHQAFLSEDKRLLLPPKSYPQERIRRNISVDWKAVSNAFVFAGEAIAPTSGERGSAALVSHLAYINDYWGTFILQGRYLGARFAQAYASSYVHFASSPGNEKALRLSWNGELPRRLHAALFWETYASVEPNPRRRSNKGSMLQTELQWGGYGRQLIWRTRWSMDETQRSMKSSFSYLFQATRALRLVPTMSWSHYRHQTAVGAGLKLAGDPSDLFSYRLSGQYFSAPNFLQAISSNAYRSPHDYYSPRYYGKGAALAALCYFQPSKSVRLSLKGHYVHYFKALSKTPAPVGVELSLQLRSF